jgi:hypothetical protein
MIEFEPLVEIPERAKVCALCVNFRKAKSGESVGDRCVLVVQKNIGGMYFDEELGPVDPETPCEAPPGLDNEIRFDPNRQLIQLLLERRRQLQSQEKV